MNIQVNQFADRYSFLRAFGVVLVTFIGITLVTGCTQTRMSVIESGQAGEELNYQLYFLRSHPHSYGALWFRIYDGKELDDHTKIGSYDLIEDIKVTKKNVDTNRVVFREYRRKVGWIVDVRFRKIHFVDFREASSYFD